MMRIINRLEDILIGLLLVTITLLVFIEVVARFGFNTGIHWVQEATLLTSAWMTLLGSAWLVRERAHICVDALTDRLAPQVRKWVLLVAIAIGLVYCGMFLKSSWVYVSKLHMIGIELEDIAIPKWTVVSGLLVGFGLLTLRLLQLAVAVWKLEAKGFHEHKESELHDENLDDVEEEKEEVKGEKA
ncbi:TRAP transporter small permease [Oceanobacter kriegii]|uniref:TRAP transporter small permease n=1 Tax=Oceanobacter kriegii TaxID=64972 RepID=UPI0004285499|nr:TRAP transporter small permease [Oceanobacter kriegii]